MKCLFGLGNENVEYQQYFEGKSYLEALARSGGVGGRMSLLNRVVVIIGIFIIKMDKFY